MSSTIVLVQDDAESLWTESRAEKLNFALGALDADRGAGCLLLVRVGRHAKMGHGDGLRLSRGFVVGGCTGGEAEEDSRGLVCTGEVVQGHM